MVRDKRMFGLKFRRQQIIDGFIADFYSDSLELCIEIDGGVHESCEQKNYDQQRDEIIVLRGLKILRFSNIDILSNKVGVMQKIEGYIDNAC